MFTPLPRFHPFLQPLSRLWSRLVEPVAAVQGKDARRQTRVVLSLLLTFIFFTALATVAIFLMYLAGDPVDFHLIGAMLLAVELVSFLIARSGRMQWGITALCLGTSVVLIISSTWYSGEMGVSKLYGLTVIGLIGALFLPARPFITLGAVQLTLIFFAPLYIPGATFEQVHIGPLQIFILVTVIHTLLMVHRGYLQQELAESQERYHDLLDNINDIVTVTDLTGRVLLLNKAARHFYNPDAQPERQSPVSADIFSYILPEDMPILVTVAEQLDSTGQSGIYRLRVRDAHGDLRWMECRSTANLRDDQRISTTTVSRDVTEQHQHAERLRESEAQLRFLIERLASFAYRLTIDQATGVAHQEMIAGSRVEVTGYADDEVPDIARIFAPEYQQAAYDNWYRVFRGEPRTFEAQIIRKDGERRWARVHYYPQQKGELFSVIVATQDITLQKAEDARQLEAAMEDARLQTATHIVQAISHEFRTHLATAQTSSYLLGRLVMPLIEDAGAREQAEAKIAALHQVVQRMTGQLDNLKMVTMLVKPTLTRCALVPLLNSLCDELMPHITENRHHLTRHLPDADPLLMMATPDELARALRQIVQNAITHTPPGSRIAVSAARQDDDGIEVRVQDEGGGIAEEHRAHIFDLFYRSDEARSTDQGGMGVGLSIARMIVEAFNGTIEVSSDVGKGSTFILRFPAAPQ